MCIFRLWVSILSASHLFIPPFEPSDDLGDLQWVCDELCNSFAARCLQLRFKFFRVEGLGFVQLRLEEFRVLGFRVKGGSFRLYLVTTGEGENCWFPWSYNPSLSKCPSTRAMHFSQTCWEPFCAQQKQHL